MTLFIACLLIYGLDLSPWLYLLSFPIWLLHKVPLLIWLRHLKHHNTVRSS